MKIINQTKFLINRWKNRSQDRREINLSELDNLTSESGWMSVGVPQKQWNLVSAQISKFQKGDEVPEFDCFVKALKIGLTRQPGALRNLLEIGCSTGYYGSLLALAFPGVSYTGVDFSHNFISFGKSKFPDLSLEVGDTTKLKFNDEQFGTVVSGSVLLHVPNWKLGMSETCRVASNLVVFHRTPVSLGPTTLYTKVAYGERMIEWSFNEAEFLDEIAKRGFDLLDKLPVYQGQKISNNPHQPTQFTYVLERQGNVHNSI